MLGLAECYNVCYNVCQYYLEPLVLWHRLLGFIVLFASKQGQHIFGSCGLPFGHPSRYQRQNNERALLLNFLGGTAFAGIRAQAGVLAAGKARKQEPTPPNDEQPKLKIKKRAQNYRSSSPDHVAAPSADALVPPETIAAAEPSPKSVPHRDLICSLSTPSLSDLFAAEGNLNSEDTALPDATSPITESPKAQSELAQLTKAASSQRETEAATDSSLLAPAGSGHVPAQQSPYERGTVELVAPSVEHHDALDKVPQHEHPTNVLVPVSALADRPGLTIQELGLSREASAGLLQDLNILALERCLRQALHCRPAIFKDCIARGLSFRDILRRLILRLVEHRLAASLAGQGRGQGQGTADAFGMPDALPRQAMHERKRSTQHPAGTGITSVSALVTGQDRPSAHPTDAGRLLSLLSNRRICRASTGMISAASAPLRRRSRPGVSMLRNPAVPLPLSEDLEASCADSPRSAPVSLRRSTSLHVKDKSLNVKNEQSCSIGIPATRCGAASTPTMAPAGGARSVNAVRACQHDHVTSGKVALHWTAGDAKTAPGPRLAEEQHVPLPVCLPAAEHGAVPSLHADLQSDPKQPISPVSRAQSGTRAFLTDPRALPAPLYKPALPNLALQPALPAPPALPIASASFPLAEAATPPRPAQLNMPAWPILPARLSPPAEPVGRFPLADAAGVANSRAVARLHPVAAEHQAPESAQQPPQKFKRCWDLLQENVSSSQADQCKSGPPAKQSMAAAPLGVAIRHSIHPPSDPTSAFRAGHAHGGEGPHAPPSLLGHGRPGCVLTPAVRDDCCGIDAI